MSIFNNWCNFSASNDHLKMHKFKNIKPKHAIQKDGYNCGVYVCAFFERLISTKSLESKLDTKKYRKIIKNTLIEQSDLKKSKNRCFICYSSDQQKVLKSFSCGHSFHIDCNSFHKSI